MVAKQQSNHCIQSFQTGRSFFFIIVAILFSLNLSSCATNFAHHMAIKNVKGITDVYPGQDDPAPSDGRLIIYWEKMPMVPAFGNFQLKGEAGHIAAAYMSQTGIVMDLPEGEYSLSAGGIVNKQEIPLKIEAGKTYCFNTSTIVTLVIAPMSGVLTAVPPQECLSEIAEKDIRCSLNNCLVQTIIPSKGRNFKQYQLENNHKQAELKSKELFVSSEKSRIYITRDMYTLGMVKAGLDAEPAFTMAGDTYACYEVEPGYHTITVSDPNGERGFRLKTKRGGIYYFHTDTLNFLEPSKGKELIGDYDLLKNGFLVEQPDN